MDKKTEEIIIKKLDSIIKLMVFNISKEKGNQKEKISLLSMAGFQPKEIAETLQTTANVVRVALFNLRKKKKGKKGIKPISPDPTTEE